MTQNADLVRQVRDAEWPPPTILKWVHGHTIRTAKLIDELRFWLEWAEYTEPPNGSSEAS